MVKEFPGVSSPSLAFNSASKYSKSVEESPLVNLEKLSPRKMSRRTSKLALWADPMPVKPEESNSTTSKDSKS